MYEMAYRNDSWEVERDLVDTNLNAFHFSFKAYVLLIVLVLRPIKICVFINNQHVLCWNYKKKCSVITLGQSCWDQRKVEVSTVLMAF